MALSMLQSGILTILIVPFLSSHGNGNPFSAYATQSIKYAQVLIHFNPLTIRLSSINLGSGTCLERYSEYFLGSIVPVIIEGPVDSSATSKFLSTLRPDRRKQKSISESALQMHSFLTIVVSASLSIQDNHIINLYLAENFNRKLDFLLLIVFQNAPIISGQKTSMLISANFPALSNILHKVVLTFDPDRRSGEFLLQSLKSLGNQTSAPYQPYDNLPERPLRNLRMGYNLPGRHFLMSMTDAAPYSFVPPRASSPESKNATNFQGSYINLFHFASVKFNFTFKITNDGLGYGKRLPNGTWIGKYAKIYYADSGYDIGLLLPNNQMMRRGDRSFPITVLSVSFVMAIPPKGHVPWYAFFQPFKLSIWLLICFVFTLIGILFTLLALQSASNQMDMDFIWNTGICIPLSIALEQSAPFIPARLRCPVMIWLWACIVLGTGYKSKLRTFMMFPASIPIPSTFEDLAERRDIQTKIFILGNVEQDFFFGSSPFDTPLVKALRSHLTEEKSWINCLRSAILTEKQACLTWTTGKSLIAQLMTLGPRLKPCHFSTEEILQSHIGMGFQENSIFAGAFDGIISSVHELGLMKKWEEDFLYQMKQSGGRRLLNRTDFKLINKLIQGSTQVDDKSALTFKSLLSVFGIFAVGLGLASVSAGFERLFSYFSGIKASQSMFLN